MKYSIDWRETQWIISDVEDIASYLVGGTTPAFAWGAEEKHENS